MIPDPLPPDALGTLGIDPGPTTGMLLAVWQPGIRAAVLVRAFECDAATAPFLLHRILDTCASMIARIGIEEFRSGPRSQRLRGTRASTTRDLVTDLAGIARDRWRAPAARPAALVKPWATDERLDRAGLLAPTAGLPDARDGGRHALYAAAHDCGLPDPLSRRDDRGAAARDG